MSTHLTDAQRLVIKVGSALLVGVDGQLRRKWFDSLIADVAALQAGGKEVVIVSSGAVALGRAQLGLGDKKKNGKLEEAQAAAAAGQITLAHAYSDALASHGIKAAQILLTLADSEERRRYLNARNTIDQLLRLGVVPVVNENDTVATQEIRYGDNDRLAARVAQMISADALILLSDVDGLYDKDPRSNPDARHIAEVTGITPVIEAMAGGSQTDMGSGGMITKLEAAKIALSAGCAMAITLGTAENPVAQLQAGSPATWFLPESGPKAARKQWIAGSLETHGSLTVDDGAAKALKSGRSLLPAGVTGLDGRFERGDAVAIKNGEGAILGRGLVAYDHTEAEQIIGRQSGEIEGILGYAGRSALIHADDLVMTEKA